MKRFLLFAAAAAVLVPATVFAQVCVACSCMSCSTVPLNCPGGQTIQVTSCPCVPDNKTMTLSVAGRGSMTCNCCTNDCEAMARTRFCTATSSPSPTTPSTPAGPITTFAPRSGSTDLLGPEKGEPFLQRNHFLDDEGRRQNVGTRSRAITGANSNSRPMAGWSARDSFHQLRRKTPGCFQVSQTAKYSYFRTLPVTATAPDSPESTWPPVDPLAPLPMIAPDEGLAQSIGGVGITVGPPDTPPPPTPETVNRPSDCRKGWHYKPAAKTCYFSKTSCGRDCVPPPNPDPNLGPGGHVNKPTDCPAGSHYNNENRSCYPSLEDCQRHLQPQAGTTCTVPNP
ncbi:MAG: hypothetical protein ACYC8T_27920 [Myxococcaceae bacterium]